MVYKVLIVDDSTFYRRRVREILNEDRELEVIDEARNGQEAIEKIKALKPDVVTMDVEMPVMDGIAAVKKAMSECPVPIIMFSSLTHDGAQATLDALEAGALDFLPKRFEDIAQDRKEASSLLKNKVRMIARRGGITRNRGIDAKGTSTPRTSRTTFLRSSNVLTGNRTSVSSSMSSTPSSVPSSMPAVNVESVKSVVRSGKRYKVLAIGASTGGPVALQKVLTALPVNFPYPIVLVQHMPGTFTTAFAQRLNNHCKIEISEAVSGDVLKPGHAYLAPGGKQMLIEGTTSQARIKVTDASADEKISYKPSVDLTFGSLARVFGGDVLGVILTGMGADGREGSRTLKGRGAKIWAQDQESCVVYGMPQAVAQANISEKNIGLENIASCILTEMG